MILRDSIESDVDDRLRHPIDPEEEDGYGSSWRREWDGERWVGSPRCGLRGACHIGVRLYLQDGFSR